MWDWISKLQELISNNIPVALVTVIDTGGSSPRDSGTKMLVLSNGEIFGTIGGGQFENQVIQEAINCLIENTNKKSTYNLSVKSGQCCGGVMEVFIEPVGNTTEDLIIFGNGHVAKAVLETMKGTKFKVHLLDMHKEDWKIGFQKIYSIKKNNYLVIMTHDHKLDEEILEHLLNTDCKYLGMIGSATKWQRFQKRLLEKGASLETMKKVKCPIGLKVWGKAPKEIAISLAAELLDISIFSP